MNGRYRHTQLGYLIIGAFDAAIVLIVVIMAIQGFDWVPFAVLLVVAVSEVLFATLTVTVDEEAVRVSFGPGLFRKMYRLADIEACQPARHPWYYGWGIRLIPGGWLFRVSGLGAVELRLKGGGVRAIGTDEPDRLAAAIQQALESKTR